MATSEKVTCSWNQTPWLADITLLVSTRSTSMTPPGSDH